MGEHSRVRSRVRVALVAGSSVLVLGLSTAGYAQAGPAPTAGTPCSIEGDGACVSLASKQAWLVDDGAVLRGPVPVSVGAPGHETPVGQFAVEWKHDDHRSSEFNDAPMPWAVFFAEGGIAFHEGNLGTPSAGCVRLGAGDAQAFYEFLEIGDPVEVH